MKKIDWEEMMMDDIMGELAPYQKSMLEAEMKKSPHLLARYAELALILNGVEELPLMQAPDSLTRKFDVALAEEMNKAQSIGATKVRRMSWFHAAAAVGLLLIGVASIMWVKNSHQAELMAIRGELRETKDMMIQLLNEQSTSSRIKGINVSYTISKPDNELLTVLIEKLRNDKSTNVRLAAVEALNQFSDSPMVKDALIKALATEQDAIVQISIIHAIVQVKERKALKTMEKLLEDESTSNDVKDEIRLGILKMT